MPGVVALLRAAATRPARRPELVSTQRTGLWTGEGRGVHRLVGEEERPTSV